MKIDIESVPCAITLVRDPAHFEPPRRVALTACACSGWSVRCKWVGFASADRALVSAFVQPGITWHVAAC